MPVLTYECKKCGKTFDAFLLSGEKAACPKCGGKKLEWIPGGVFEEPKSKGKIKAARAQAEREGHMSNYSRSSRQRLRQGKSER